MICFQLKELVFVIYSESIMNAIKLAKLAAMHLIQVSQT